MQWRAAMLVMTASRPRSTACAGGWVRSTQGAVFVEFLIAFLPVYVFFLCLLQLALLVSVKLVTEHAAASAARAAAVVLGDDPKLYRGTKPHEFKEPKLLRAQNPRYKAVKSAAVLALLPLIANGTVQMVSVVFAPPEEPGGEERSKVKLAPMGDQEVEKVRVRVDVTTQCRISFANYLMCGLLRTMSLSAEAIYPYQGAYYDYAT
jgi:hypothetical protein